MTFEVEEDDAHPIGHSNATVTDEQGDCHRKGKGIGHFGRILGQNV